MRDWYDHISEQDAIEEQARIMPNGPLGMLLQPEIKIDGELPPESKDIVNRFLKGDVGSIEAMTELEKLKRKTNEADTVLKP
jgi:hypothetical protein